MDPGHHEYILEVFADQTFVKDIVKGKEPAIETKLRPSFSPLCDDDPEY